MYRKNAWKKYEDKAVIMEFNEGYKKFISENKDERLIIKESVRQLEEHGFVNGDSLESLGDHKKVYFVNKKKTLAAFILGKKPITAGLRILGAHVDSPRLDLKEHPIYEANGFALADTHYYGGVKKYQWVTIPLALFGVIVKKDGTVIDVKIGEDENDPIVGITDLLIHLSADQMSKTLARAIEGEALDITLGNMPLSEDEKEPVKANVLRILKEKYGVEEEDFVSAVSKVQHIQALEQQSANNGVIPMKAVSSSLWSEAMVAYTSLKAIPAGADNSAYAAVLATMDSSLNKH